MPRRKPKQSSSRSQFKPRVPKSENKQHLPKSIKQVEGKTDNQSDYIECIMDYDIIFCTGPAGCGKSYIAAGMAAKYLFEKQYDQIIVTRPLVCTGKDIGSLPGELCEKINPYLAPMQENLRYFLGNDYYGLFVNERKIRFEPLEMMRGSTFNNSIMILDEAQNCTVEQIKMFVTRIGKGSKVLINGDIKQSDIKGKSGLEFCISKVGAIEEIAVCRLTYDDIQRNDIIYKFIRAIEE